MRNTKSAFTLVELIVVITILAILGTIAFISLQGYSADARNSKRTSDLGNIQSTMALKAVEWVSIVNFVTNNEANTIGGNSTIALAGTWATALADTEYVAGAPAYTVLNIAEKDFKDPQDKEYIIAATTKRGSAYQLSASLESDWGNVALVTWTYVARSNTNTGALTAVNWDTVTVNWEMANFFKRGDRIDINSFDGGVTVEKVSKDGTTLTLSTSTGATTQVIQLNTSESTGLIADKDTNTNPVINNSTTTLPY